MHLWWAYLEKMTASHDSNRTEAQKEFLRKDLEVAAVYCSGLFLTTYTHYYFPLLLHLINTLHMINHQSDEVDEIETQWSITSLRFYRIRKQE